MATITILSPGDPGYDQVEIAWQRHGYDTGIECFNAVWRAVQADEGHINFLQLSSDNGTMMSDNSVPPDWTPN